jgi:hypothetical protein
MSVFKIAMNGGSTKVELRPGSGARDDAGSLSLRGRRFGLYSGVVVVGGGVVSHSCAVQCRSDEVLQVSTLILKRKSKTERER